ncbi:MAG: DUF3305 domain-containing protein [Bradyrhizobiaceae bacterium]|nr:DUF3305 domain-containing protein [Hyphomicrobiales bacterium]MBV9428940.1 DUF3305 domain-containing protein [Bradyrhizobiaceae bacterium]
MSTALARIAVGVVVERRPATNPWIEHVWRPIGVLTGVPEAAPWTSLPGASGADTFYAGAAEVELHRTETANYQDNLTSGQPSLWVVLRPTDGDPPFTVVTVTADPAEGEAFTETATDLVEAVPMPESIAEAVAAFVAEHHVERTFEKRKRDRADPEALGRRRTEESR